MRKPKRMPAPPPREPAPDERAFPVVGIGASAGGLAAFREFLERLPPATGMAYVLIPHLDPTHESILSEILSKTTRFPVQEVRGDTLLEPDHVYVISPDTVLTMAGRTLRITPRESGVRKRGAIDQFLISLAREYRDKAIGVILSGSASDGAAGIRAIKAEGGLTFAQDESAQFPQMPQNAIATGAVDFILPPQGIAEELARIRNHSYLTGRGPVTPTEPRSKTKNDAVARILTLLRGATGVDFSQYKQTTVQRRIARRMALCRLERMDEYLLHLQNTPSEVRALHDEILIHVTSFFRDPESFEALKAATFPRMLAGRSAKDPIRVWVPGCSTGEEAYSIAILLAEFLAERGTPQEIQVFGTDVSETAIEKARAGIYDNQIQLDVSPERLKRFFVPSERGTYQISKAVRDLCVFARQDVTRDAPFSRLDLLTCRNVLIYLGPTLQKRVVPIFHYALKPAGFLMLGPSETLRNYGHLFSPVDKKHMIYSKVNGTIPPRADWDTRRVARSAEIDASAERQPWEDTAPPFDVRREADRLLLSQRVPPGIIIDDDAQVIEVRGETSPYLRPAPGKPSLNLFKMVREELLPELDAAIRRARQEKVHVRKERIPFVSDGRSRYVTIDVFPLGSAPASVPCLLVLFEEAPPQPSPEPGPREVPVPAGDPGGEDDRDREMLRLRQELAATREYQKSVVEKLEAAHEALQSTHEELLSSNEELQSSNEEMETSQEELQSGNEELATLNDELQNRNLELGQLNSDLANVISSVNVPIVIVDAGLRLRRFNPMAEKLFNVRPTDINRRITDFRLAIDVPDLETLVTGVIDTLSPVEREVQDNAGRWYALRVRPYRTAENRIDGAVVVLVDIDALKRSMAEIEDRREFTEAIVNTVRDPLLILDKDLRVLMANRSFYETFRVSREKTEKQLLYELGNRQWDIPGLRRALEEILPRNTVLEHFETEHDYETIGPRTMIFHARRISFRSSRETRILLAIEDVTERKGMERRFANMVSERERQQLGQDLHDGLGQDIAGITLLCQALENKVSGRGAVSGMKRISRLLDGALEKTRWLAKSLYPIGLETAGLAKYLVEMAAFMSDNFSVACRITWDARIPNLDLPVATNLYWIVHEAVINAVRHGKSRSIWIAGKRNGNKSSTITVRDDGIGLPEAPAQQSGMGLSIMKARAESIGASLTIANRPEGGTQVTCELPDPAGRK
jgi:two-component system CheB/CheR fusion protein